MNFSIVLATRQRSTLLVNFMRSLAETTADLSQLEVIVVYDNDDLESADAANHISSWYPWVKFLHRDRSNNLNNDYLNWAYATLGTGKYAIIANDDVEAKTKNWDTIVLEKLNYYLSDKPDGVVYGYLEDSIVDRHGMQYCCFPLLSRAGIKALEFAMTPELTTWGADIAIWQIYSRVNRVCNLSPVLFQHISYHSNLRSRDEVSLNVQRNVAGMVSHTAFNEYVSRLQRAIDRKGADCVGLMT